MGVTVEQTQHEKVPQLERLGAELLRPGRLELDFSRFFGVPCPDGVGRRRQRPIASRTRHAADHLDARPVGKRLWSILCFDPNQGQTTRIQSRRARRKPVRPQDVAYENEPERIRELVHRGLEMLRQPDPEDSDYMKLRVIEKDRIWAVLTGEGYTFMRSDEY